MVEYATRYDKLAANYLAFVQLASIRLWLRANESTSQRKLSHRVSPLRLSPPLTSEWLVPLDGS
jgi:hypothetical protein